MKNFTLFTTSSLTLVGFFVCGGGARFGLTMKKVLALLLLTGMLVGQESTIVLKDGRTIKGTIVFETEESLYLSIPLEPQVKILKSDIVMNESEIDRTELNEIEKFPKGTITLAKEVLSELGILEEVEEQARMDVNEDFGLDKKIGWVAKGAGIYLLKFPFVPAFWGALVGLSTKSFFAFVIPPILIGYSLPVNLPEHRQKALSSKSKEYQAVYRTAYKKSVRISRSGSFGITWCPFIISGTLNGILFIT